MFDVMPVEFCVVMVEDDKVLLTKGTCWPELITAFLLLVV